MECQDDASGVLHCPHCVQGMLFVMVGGGKTSLLCPRCGYSEDVAT